MPTYTPAQAIGYAKISQYLAEVDIAKKAGDYIDLRLPRLLYVERKSFEFLYNQDPTHADLTVQGNYLISLCGPYLFKAISIFGSGTGVASGGSNSEAGQYLIPITGADFASATAYNNTIIVGKTLEIFWNSIQRYLTSAEFSMTSTGFVVNVGGFDATTTNLTDIFKIYILNP
jgi:hypothetical protein